MAGIFELDGKVFNLKLGKSFDNDGDVAFHSMRYDFKPASIDTSKDAILEVNEGNNVTVTVPHVEGSGMSHTIFKGNKRPSQKECILIINHETNEVTLEKLSYSMQVKSTRSVKSGNGKQKSDAPAQPTAQPTSQPAAQPPVQQDRPKTFAHPPRSETAMEAKAAHEKALGNLSASSSSEDEMSNDSSSSSSDDSDDEAPVTNNDVPKPTFNHNNDVQKPAYTHSVLSSDLQLSEDSDSSDCDMD